MILGAGGTAENKMDKGIIANKQINKQINKVIFYSNNCYKEN